RWWYLQKITATLVRSFGYPAAVPFATRLAAAGFELNPPLRRVIEQNIRCASVASGEAHVTALAQNVFQQAARFWAEVLSIPRRFSPNTIARHVAWNDAAAWDALSGSSRPLILVSPY